MNYGLLAKYIQAPLTLSFYLLL